MLEVVDRRNVETYELRDVGIRLKELSELRQSRSNVEERAVENVGERSHGRLHNLAQRTIRGKDNGLVKLTDGLSVDTDFTADGVNAGVCSRRRHLQSPDTIFGESHERVLAKLALRERTGCGSQTDDVACTYGVDSLNREVERVVLLRGVDAVVHRDNIIDIVGGS